MRTGTGRRLACGYALAVLALAAGCAGDERGGEARSAERTSGARGAEAPPPGDTSGARAAEAPPSPGAEGVGGADAPPSRRAAVVRLPSGDSVEYVGVGPALLPDQPPGLLVTYHPFFSPDTDTLRVKRVADEFWRASVRPGLKELPPFVVLRATSRRAGPIRGRFTEATFGVVLERRSDGTWYRYGTSESVQ